MQKKLIKLTSALLFTVAMIISLWIFFSPYKKHLSNKSEIKNEVIINAPIEQVYSFLGNSANAKRWSVFVKDIVPLNANEVSDGSVNSRRRCYVKEEFLKDAYWDELITEVKPLKKRQLLIYNLQNFSVEAEGLVTEQLYHKIDNNKTKLTFRLMYKENMESLWNEAKTHLAAYEINDIFVKNMNNIKAIIESEKSIVQLSSN